MNEMFSEKDLEWLFRPLEGHGKVARYPLTNIGVDACDNLIIEVAIAGFDKDDLDIEVKGNDLHISGELPNYDGHSDVEYYQKHISSDNFERIISLRDDKYVNGEISANVINGILKISIKPKEAKRRMIVID